MGYKIFNNDKEGGEKSSLMFKVEGFDAIEN
jgi:hypothetical protein